MEQQLLKVEQNEPKRGENSNREVIQKKNKKKLTQLHQEEEFYIEQTYQ